MDDRKVSTIEMDDQPELCQLLDTYDRCKKDTRCKKKALRNILLKVTLLDDWIDVYNLSWVGSPSNGLALKNIAECEADFKIWLGYYRETDDNEIELRKILLEKLSECDAELAQWIEVYLEGDEKDDINKLAFRKISEIESDFDGLWNAYAAAELCPDLRAVFLGKLSKSEAPLKNWHQMYVESDYDPDLRNLAMEKMTANGETLDDLYKEFSIEMVLDDYDDFEDCNLPGLPRDYDGNDN